MYFELKVPLAHQEDENVTLHFEVKKNTMIGIETYAGEINDKVILHLQAYHNLSTFTETYQCMT